MAVSENVTMLAGSDVITILGPDNSAQPAPSILGVVTGQTLNFTRYSYRKTALLLRRWTHNFANRPSNDKEIFENFYVNVIQGPLIPFEYTHTDGIIYPDVRIIDTEMPFVREGPNQWAWSFTLEFRPAVPDEEGQGGPPYTWQIR